MTRLIHPPPPRPLSSIGQRQTDEEVALGLFSLTKSKIKTLFQASIIDSCSKLFTLNLKQTLLDTVLACPVIVSFRELEQQAHFLLQVVTRVNQVVASV